MEVFHAHFTDHAYPMHAHGTWTLLLIDEGAVRYDLDRHERGAVRAQVTLLPPRVPHNGCAATPHGFRKRVLYLDTTQLGEDLIGNAVDMPELHDPQLRRQIDQLHRTLASPGEEFEAESRLALIYQRLIGHLRRRAPTGTPPAGRGTAGRLRELLDARTVEGVRLDEAARLLHAHPAQLVRAFSREFGMPPHRYLTSRRVDRARQLLLDGRPPAAVAASTGFYDQSHLTRHFTRIVGTSPGHYRATRRRDRAQERCSSEA